ncbi:hypothetical protein D3C78_1651810 [compost metagenome]
MLISVLPTSMEMFTGISRITSRLGPSRLTFSFGFGELANSSIGRRPAPPVLLPVSPPSSASISAWPAAPVSSSAAAHSSASAWSSAEVISFSLAMVSSTGIQFVMSDRHAVSGVRSGR